MFRIEGFLWRPIGFWRSALGKGAYLMRNRWMVEQARLTGGYLIAAYDGRKSGGTAQTVRQARQKGLAVEMMWSE